LAEERRTRQADERRHRHARRKRIRWTARTAFVAAAAGLAALALGLPRGGDGPEIATAAEIKAKVAAALSSARSVGGELVVHGASYRNAYGWERRRWTFALTASGDFRFTHDGGTSDLAYDASKGVERSLGTFSGDYTKRARERTGIAPGPPDHGPADYFLQRDFGAVVRALLAASDPQVTETTYEGRAAWKLDIAATPNAIVPELSGDHFEITVDKETGFPLRVVETKGGKFLDEIRIEDMEIDSKLTASDFTIRFPPGAKVDRTDNGFRRVRLDQVAGVVGYAPLMPGDVPRGYELTEIAVAKKGYPTGAEGGNPWSMNVVSLAYRRGLDRFIVTTRLSRVPVPGEPERTLEELWGDPLATGEGYRDKPERVRLAGGALAGVEAELLIVPRNTPHIWALTDKLVVTIAGDLSRAELIAVAESLERR